MSRQESPQLIERDRLILMLNKQVQFPSILGIALKKCSGQTYGASVLQGALNGIGAQIRKEVPTALGSHCLTRNLQLTLQEVAAINLLIRDAVVTSFSQKIGYVSFYTTRKQNEVIFETSLAYKIKMDMQSKGDSICPGKLSVTH